MSNNPFGLYPGPKVGGNAATKPSIRPVAATPNTATTSITPQTAPTDDLTNADDELPPPYVKYLPEQTLRPPPGQPENQYSGQGPSTQYAAPGPHYPNYPIPTPQHGYLMPHQPYGSSPTSFYPSSYPPMPMQAPSAPFLYPPGYVCPKCRNTGIKYSSGTPCGTCARTFARPQSAAVSHLPPGIQVMPTAGAPVVQAGDPRLGGILCGHCKGRGWVDGFFSTDNCYVCHGIGRIR